MDDQLDLDLDSQESNEEIINRKDKRLKTLADKVREKEETLTKEAEARKKAEEEKASLEVERNFFKDFNKLSAKYQGATEYQDKIFEKVKSGYDPEDATISILAKEGKFTPQTPEPEKERAAGGSATTSMSIGDKSIQEMSHDEKRSALLEMESKGEFHL